jgi:hypothetical protein
MGMKRMLKQWFSTHQILFVFILSIVLILALVVVVTERSSAPSSSDSPDIQLDNTPVTAEGEIVCLPHQNTESPQTLECAYGMKTVAGTYYALSDPTSDYSFLTSAGSGERVKVTGTFKTNKDSKYQDKGTITITALDKL